MPENRMNTNPEWLMKMAAKEDGCSVSVGGGVPNILTAERALEEAQRLCLGYGAFNGIHLLWKQVAITLLTSAMNEASDEVCVWCGTNCIEGCKFLSRRAALQGEIEKLKG